MAQNDLFKRYLDAGMAFTALTQSRAEALVKDLVKAGEVQADQAREAVSDLLERSRSNTEKLLETVRQEVRSQITGLGLASQDDLDRLEARLAGLFRGASGPSEGAGSGDRSNGPGRTGSSPAVPTSAVPSAGPSKAPASAPTGGSGASQAPSTKKAGPAKKAATAKKAAAPKKAATSTKKAATSTKKAATSTKKAGPAKKASAKKSAPAPVKKAPAKKAASSPAGSGRSTTIGGPGASPAAGANGEGGAASTPSGSQA